MITPKVSARSLPTQTVMITKIIRRITESRSKRRRWTYIFCAAVVVPVGILFAGMAGDLVATLPYLLIIAVCVCQFLRPTILGWFMLTALFAAYTVAVVAGPRLPLDEFVVFFLIGALPTVALLCSWPKARGTEEESWSP